MQIAVQRQQHIALPEGIFAVIDPRGSSAGDDEADFMADLYVRFPGVAGIGVNIADLVQDKRPELDRIKIKQIVKVKFGVFGFQSFFSFPLILWIIYSTF